MSEHPPNDARAASGSVADREELEAPASTVRLDDLFAIVRRHIRLVLGWLRLSWRPPDVWHM